MDKIWLTLQLLMGGFCIILFIKVWSMTNDVKELKNLIINNNRSMTNKVEEFKNYYIDYMTRYEEEGSVVYDKKDHKEYTVVRVLSNGKLLLDDNPIKTNIVELSTNEVIKKGDEVYSKEYGEGRKRYIVAKVLPNGMLLLDDGLKDVKLSVDEIDKL